MIWIFGRKKQNEAAAEDTQRLDDVRPELVEASDANAARSNLFPQAEAVDTAEIAPQVSADAEAEADVAAPQIQTTDTGRIDISDLPAEESLPAHNSVLDERPRTRADRVGDALDEWGAAMQAASQAPSFLHQLRGGQNYLDLTHAHPSGLAQLLAGRGPTRLSSLVREAGALTDARRHARSILETASRWAEDAGLVTCHLGIGEATWIDPSLTDENGQSVKWHAPVLLRPLTLEIRGNAREDIDLSLDATVELNPFLLRSLREAGVALDTRALLATTEGSYGFDQTPVIDALEDLGEPLPGFTVKQALVVGNVIDTAVSLVDDLQTGHDNWVDNDLIAALASDEEAHEQLNHLPAAVMEDSETITALDQDERAVVQAALAGSHVAVNTAVGADPSGLIMNLASELTVRGKNVLVVAQRRSSMQQLAAEAARRGAEDLVLNLSPSPSLQRQAAAEIRAALCGAGRAVEPVLGSDEAELVRTREILAGHVQAMHRTQQPWGVSAHETMSALADLTRRRPSPKTNVKFSAEVAARMVGAEREKYAELLQQAAESGALSHQVEENAWFGAAITTDTQATNALELVEYTHAELLPKLRERAVETGPEIGLEPVSNLDQYSERLNLLARLRAVLRDFQPAIFQAPLDDLVAATAPKQWRVEHDIQMGWWERRRLVKQAQQLVRPGAAVLDLNEKLRLVKKVRAEWVLVAVDRSGKPRQAQDQVANEQLRDRALKTFDELGLLLGDIPGGKDLAKLSFAEVEALCVDLEEAADILSDLPKHTSLLQRLSFDGLDDLVADLREREVAAAQVSAELELAWYRSVLEHIAAAEPTISSYDGTSLSQVANQYRKLDAKYLAGASDAIRLASDRVLVATMKANPDTSRTLIRELSRSSTTSLRDLAAKYEQVMLRTHPIWLVSPYVVPQVIPPGQHFDVVIVADAGRLPTAAAAPALVRAKQVIAVGDPLEYADTQEVVAANESASGTGILLDDMKKHVTEITVRRDDHPGVGMLRRFVWQRFYEQDLLSVPSPVPVEEDRLIYVEGANGPVTPDGETVESTEAELNAVTEAVIEHARNRPETSLAVLTLTPTHAEKLLERIIQTVSVIPALRDFFAPDVPEFFTVVPATQATAIIRDEIIVSLGFGKTPHDRVLHRFGPLSTPYGERALASVLTRARGRTRIFSGLKSSDLDPDRLKSRGGQELRHLLEVMEGKVDLLAIDADETETSISDLPPSQPLMADLGDRLWRLGLIVESNYGDGADKLELALAHPDLPNQMLVAIESDGDAYLDTPSQRERDRLRVERLESAGWVVERVWSWALFIDPQGEAERIYKTVCRLAQEAPKPRFGVGEAANKPRHALPRPQIPAGHPLSFYSSEDFDQVVEYICSDGRARLEDQLASEVRDFLGFTTRTVLLDVTISSAIRRYQERL